MKIGLSTYSLYEALKSGEMTVPDIIQWVSDQGGEHVEISLVGFDLVENPELIDPICRKIEQTGITASSYTVGAQLLQESREAFDAEVSRLMRHVETAAKMGIQLMRHDACSRPPEEATIEQFEADLPHMIEGIRRIADHAMQHGITTSVENHGYHVQNSDRVRRLIYAVDRPNYRWTLDVGNFVCVDEDPLYAVRNAMPFAVMVHFKDFYIRPSSLDPGEGWFRSSSGKYLRGAIVGQGDIDIRSILKILKDHGYDGFLSVEFEGMEDCRLGSRIGMENLRRLVSEC